MSIRRAILLTRLVVGVTSLIPAPAQARARDTDRPISGIGLLTNTVNLQAQTFVAEGWGRLTHLGKNTSHTEGTITPTGPNTSTTSGTTTFVAANGDVVSATMTGTATVNGPTFLTFTFIGGTGRFAHASGTMTSEGVMNLVSFDGVTAVLVGNRTLTGHISY